MKNLSIFDKIMAVVNSLLALVTLFAYTSYYISPNTLPQIAIVSLTLPFLLILNLIFVIYWLLKRKKQFLISTIILLIGIQYIFALYRLTEKKVLLTNDVKIMTYNVRMFNSLKWIKEDGIDKKIQEFINSKSPDILSIQEFHSSGKKLLDYPYKYIEKQGKGKVGQAIYSKYKIINSGSLDFESSFNNAIFIDLVKEKDTIRVYNVHLQSLGIIPEKEEFTQENTEKVRIRIQKAFKIQANQVALILKHQETTHYKTIICGDFNNNAFSYSYKQLKKGKKDAFEEAGKGFGTTYNLKHIPLRIDFILTDEGIEINNFKTYDVKYSDHFPIMARINFDSN